MEQEEVLITEAVLGRKARVGSDRKPEPAAKSDQGLPSVPGSPKKGFGRYLLRIFVGLSAFVFIALGSTGIYLYYHREEIKRLFIEEINRNLNAPVSVQDVRLGMLRDFPMLSVSFFGVNGGGTERQDTEELFRAESITLSFNLYDIVHKQYIVREILVRGGDFNLKHYGDGVYNYMIWKKGDTRRPVSFHLRRVLLRNTLVRFRDIPSHHDFQLLARNVTAKGDLYENGQDFQLKGSVGVHTMKAADFVFLQQRNASLDIRFSNDQQARRFTVQRGVIGIENLDFTTQGYVCYDKGSPYMDFRFKGKNMRMESLLSLLPVRKPKVFDDYGFKGNLAFSLAIRGNYTQAPLSVFAEFDYTQGKIRYKPASITASDVKIQGAFTNGTDKSGKGGRLHLDKFSATLPGGMISGRFSIENFRIPTIRYEGELSADLSELQRFLGVMPRYGIQGKARAELFFRHTFPSLTPRTWKSVDFSGLEANGYLKIKDFCLKVPDKGDMAVDSLHMVFGPEAVKTDPFCLRAGEQSMDVRVFAGNFFPFVLLPGENLYVTARLKSRELDWAALSLWMKDSGSRVSTDARTETDSVRRSKPAAKGTSWQHRLYADVELEVARLYLPDFTIEHLRTGLHYAPENIVLEDLRFSAFSGTFEGAAEMARQVEGERVALQGTIDGMDISSCFKAFRNFGQTQLTYRNIGGIFSAEFRLGALYLPSQGRIDPASLQLWSKLNISDGVLQNMESLRKISRFTGEDDLQDIHFADLQNVIEISDRCIRIPEMKVASSSADLSFSGKHTFDNEVDYLVNIELSDLLSRRRAQRMKKEEAFGVVTGGKSRVRLPLHISGIWPDVEIKYAFSQARKGAQERLQENRTEMKEALQEEFSQIRQKRQEREEKQAVRKRQEQGEIILDTEEVGLRKKKDSLPLRKTDTVKKKKKYKTEDDFRLEFEDD